MDKDSWFEDTRFEDAYPAIRARFLKVESERAKYTRITVIYPCVKGGRHRVIIAMGGAQYEGEGRSLVAAYREAKRAAGVRAVLPHFIYTHFVYEPIPLPPSLPSERYAGYSPSGY